MPEEPKLALFIDLENVVLGAGESKVEDFEIHRVLERLVEKGKIIVRKAYADWTVYKKYKQSLHEAGIELIDIPQRRYSGKNSADIKMVVDAMDLCYSKEHINFFVLASGDSDFAPLVSKLKENNKTVIGVGLRQSTSELLAANCDEFIFYDDLVKKPVSEKSTRRLANLPKKKHKAFEMVLDAIEALRREDKEVIWSSMVKQTIKRKQPSFTEATYGYSNFSELVEDGAEMGLFKIAKDDRSGSYVISERMAEARPR
jgi:uncharacterized protein (TIGR00288 family)